MLCRIKKDDSRLWIRQKDEYVVFKGKMEMDYHGAAGFFAAVLR